jgi:hypothetical protein
MSIPVPPLAKRLRMLKKAFEVEVKLRKQLKKLDDQAWRRLNLACQMAVAAKFNVVVGSRLKDKRGKLYQVTDVNTEGYHLLDVRICGRLVKKDGSLHSRTDVIWDVFDMAGNKMLVTLVK